MKFPYMKKFLGQLQTIPLKKVKKIKNPRQSDPLTTLTNLPIIHKYFSKNRTKKTKRAKTQGDIYQG